MHQKKNSGMGFGSPRRTLAIVLLGLAVGIATVIIVGQLIFAAVYGALHPDAGDFWQNLVTMAIAAVLTLIIGGAAFGVAVGIFYAAVYGMGLAKGGNGDQAG
ncbi:hypothetical protein [Nitrososphaera sp.]|uniref:hypothetical protein n=1 Tax=Nitrososphaera sp. TaxID=1971748 RepID=UPI00307F3FA3